MQVDMYSAKLESGILGNKIILAINSILLTIAMLLIHYYSIASVNLPSI